MLRRFKVWHFSRKVSSGSFFSSSTVRSASALLFEWCFDVDARVLVALVRGIMATE